MTAPRRLHTVPEPGEQSEADYRFDVALQITVAGPQDTAVRALKAVSGPPRDLIAVRVGRVLTYVANRKALQSFVDAWTQASVLADQTFGPEEASPAYRPITPR